jgi:hypothetical protein
VNCSDAPVLKPVRPVANPVMSALAILKVFNNTTPPPTSRDDRIQIHRHSNFLKRICKRATAATVA